jgi:hypothetical protein
VVVEEGLTVVEPEEETAPILLSMVTELAPVTFQESVLLCPVRIEPDDAVKLVMAGGGVTVTVVWAVTLPAALLAVSV